MEHPIRYCPDDGSRRLASAYAIPARGPRTRSAAERRCPRAAFGSAASRRWSAVDDGRDLVEPHRALHEDQDASIVERFDVGLGGGVVEPGVDEHLLEVVMRSDAGAL